MSVRRVPLTSGRNVRRLAYTVMVMNHPTTPTEGRSTSTAACAPTTASAPHRNPVMSGSGEPGVKRRPRMRVGSRGRSLSGGVSTASSRLSATLVTSLLSANQRRT